jgi:hypothetical protein
LVPGSGPTRLRGAFRHWRLLRIEGLSPDDIKQFLDLADGYIELNSSKPVG